MSKRCVISMDCAPLNACSKACSSIGDDVVLDGIDLPASISTAGKPRVEVIRGQALAREIAEGGEGSRFARCDRADGRAVAVDAVAEIVLGQCGPAVADDVTKVGAGLRLADGERPLYLKAEASEVPGRAPEVDDHIVQRLAKVAPLNGHAAHHPVVNSQARTPPREERIGRRPRRRLRT